MQKPWVQSLVRELRPHMPCGEAKKIKKVVIRESLALKIIRNDALDSLYFLPFSLFANQPTVGVKGAGSKIQRTKLSNTFLSLHRLNKLRIPSSEFIQPMRRVESAIKKHPALG